MPINKVATSTQKLPVKTDLPLRVETAIASEAEANRSHGEDINHGEVSDDTAGESESQDSTDDEEDDEPHEVVGFGDAMSKILSQNVAEDVQPILAKRTTARMREIQNDKKGVKTARVSAVEKREREQKDMAVPDHTTAAQDRQLRAIATKGGEQERSETAMGLRDGSLRMRSLMLTD